MKQLMIIINNLKFHNLYYNNFFILFFKGTEINQFLFLFQPYFK